VRQDEGARQRTQPREIQKERPHLARVKPRKSFSNPERGAGRRQRGKATANRPVTNRLEHKWLENLL